MIGWDSFIIINNHYTVGTGIVVYLLGVYIIVGFSRWLSGKNKNLLPMKEIQEKWVQYLGQKDSLEEEMATHSSILAWRISWTEESGRLQSTGLQRVIHDWAHYLVFLRSFLNRNTQYSCPYTAEDTACTPVPWAPASNTELQHGLWQSLLISHCG